MFPTLLTCDVKRGIPNHASELVNSPDFGVDARGHFSPRPARGMGRQTDSEIVEAPIVGDADDVRSDDVDEKTQAQSHEGDLEVGRLTQRHDGNEVVGGAVLVR